MRRIGELDKEIRKIDRNGKVNVKQTISCKIKRIDSGRFMASPLSNFVNNLAEGMNKIKCKYGNGHKKCETCGIKYK